MAEIVDVIKEFVNAANSINYQGITMLILLVVAIALIKLRY